VVALKNTYGNMYSSTRKPIKPRKPKLKKFMNISHSVTTKGKNVGAIVAAAEKILENNDTVTLKNIKIESTWGGTVTLEYMIPETDVEFAKRVALAGRWFEEELKIYNDQQKEYAKWLEHEEISKIKTAVNNHEAAVNTIAEVLKKYPDVLEKAVAKAMK